MANAKIVKITDQQGNELAPQTLMSQAFDTDGMTLESLILPKDNTSPYIPASDYNPATKSYVDNAPKTKITMSVQAPKNAKVGDMWYQIPGMPYTFAQVDALGYKFADVDELGITWADADMGSW